MWWFAAPWLWSGISAGAVGRRGTVITCPLGIVMIMLVSASD